YGGLTSSVTTQGDGTSQGSPAPGVGRLLLHDNQGPTDPTGSGASLYARILVGYNSGTYTTDGGPATVSMQWRNRSSQETSRAEGGTPASPPLQYVGSYLISNVLNLSGLGTSTAADKSATYVNANNNAYFGVN